ncbi:LysR family transcriptional regulator [Nevskia soli]|uniref:LysR family transcriptional regulator n=1 Tax=Nevskia soli TaxID=418856 RepID=UPI0004A77432|nr:LysR family transcriptional regulator [Nevskia soli]
MDLAALADFNLVAVHGGFGRANRAVGRPKATLSRRVAELEQGLGVRLIERGGRVLRLTEEGRTLHERTAGLMAELAEAGEAVASRAPIPRGRLRVSAPVVFAHVALARIGARFALAYPQVELEIVADDRVIDPVEEGYDLVIRINPAEDARLVGRRLLQDERLLVAAPGVARPALARKLGAEVPVRAVMPAAASAGTLWRMRGKGGARVLRPEAILKLSSLLMVREAVLAGVGAALLPKLLVAEDVAAGRLACWGTEDGAAVEIWALYGSRRLLSAKVRAFLDALIEAFAEGGAIPGP